MFDGEALVSSTYCHGKLPSDTKKKRYFWMQWICKNFYCLTFVSQLRRHKLFSNLLINNRCPLESRICYIGQFPLVRKFVSMLDAEPLLAIASEEMLFIKVKPSLY